MSQDEVLILEWRPPSLLVLVSSAGIGIEGKERNKKKKEWQEMFIDMQKLDCVFSLLFSKKSYFFPFKEKEKLFQI